MWSEWRKRGLLVAGSVAFAFLLTEGAFRLAGEVQGIDYRLYLKEMKNSDRLPRQLFRADPDLKTILVPNAQVLAVTSDFSVVYRTNDKGLRDREYRYEKSPRTLRILALGDSITFGEGVPYGARFADIPEESLDGLEIINAGVPGWGLESELVYLAREGVRYQPDWVVIFINWVGLKRQLPNLVRDGSVHLPTGGAPPEVAPTAAGEQDGTWYLRPDDPLFQQSGFLVRHSYALSYLRFRLTLAQRRDALEQQDAARWEAKNIDRQTPTAVTDVPQATPRIELVLQKFIELSKQEGFRLMIVNVSSFATFSFVSKVAPDVPLHELAPLLVAEAQKTPISFKYDPHYTPQTHALIGRELTKIFRPLVEEHRAGRVP